MNYRQLISLLADIIRFRAGPQDLPASTSVLVTLVLASGTVSFLGFSGNAPAATGIGQIAVASGFALLFIFLALQFRGGGSRFLQTASAVFGTDALLTFAALPAALGMNPAAESASTLAVLWLLVILLWTVGVLSHIFRHALNLPRPGGVLVAILYLLLSLNVLSALF